MKKIKIFLSIVFVLMSTTAFATWSQPTATPSNGNTQPPVNVGSVDQEKNGTITAKGLCVRKDAITLRCLGENPGTTSTFNDFPWIWNGNNIQNTNLGDILINPTRISSLWGAGTEQLTVGGKIKSEDYCIGGGNSCLNPNLSDNWTDIFKRFISNIIGPVGPVGPVGNPLNCTSSGQVLTWTISPAPAHWICATVTGGGDVIINNGGSVSGTTNRLVKFTGAKSIGDSGIIENTTNIEVTSLPLKTTKGLIIETRSGSDPATPAQGQIWLRTDL